MSINPGASPNTVPWPPLLLLAAFGGGLLLHAIFPLPVSLPRWIGWVIAIFGGALDVAAMWALWRAKANILPNRPATTLVTSGVFGLTRHPIYLGNALLVFGIGGAAGNGWMMLLAVVSFLATDRLAARREEAHLLAKFGQSWLDYAARVRRWMIV